MLKTLSLNKLKAGFLVLVMGILLFTYTLSEPQVDAAPALSKANGVPVVSGSAKAKGGDLVWEDQLGDAASAGQAVVVQGNRVFTAGGVRNPTSNFDFVVRTYDVATGALLWEDQFDKAGGIDFAVAIAVKGNRVFAAGSAANASGDRDFLVRAYDAETGALLWEDQFDEAGGDDSVEKTIIVDRNRVFVTGKVTNAAGNSDYLIRAYNAESGVLLWEDQLDQAAGFDFAFAAAVGMGNRLFAVGGVTNGAGDGDFLVRAYDAETGALLWEDQLDRAGGFDGTSSIAVQGNQVFAAGRVTKADGDADSLVRAYDGKTGDLQWEDQFDGGFNEDGAVDIIVQGIRVFVGIQTRNSTNFDFLVRAHDAKTGALLWEDQFDNGGSDDGIQAMAAKGDRVFPAGISQKGTPSGAPANTFLVRAHDAKTGALLWEENQFDQALAREITVGGNRVFVIGQGETTSGIAGSFLVRTYTAR